MDQRLVYLKLQRTNGAIAKLRVLKQLSGFIFVRSKIERSMRGPLKSNSLQRRRNQKSLETRLRVTSFPTASALLFVHLFGAVKFQ